MFSSNETEYTRMIRIKEDRYVHLSKLAKKLNMTRNKVLEMYLSEIMDDKSEGVKIRVNIKK